MYDFHEFLLPVDLAAFDNDIDYNDSQIGSIIKIYKEGDFPDLSDVDIVLAGINDFRGEGFLAAENAADTVRREWYRLHNWHTDIIVADIGNIRTGASVNDSYSAIALIVKELLQMGKTIVLLGGSHDNTLGQYFAYKGSDTIIDATVIDATIDLRSESSLRSENFLMEMLTGEPNMVRHYNHIGFQSYFVHPHMLETMDKLRFDCFRVGMVREQLDEMEPVIRSSDMISFDMAAIKSSDSPASAISPNGFTGEEACSLIRYAGMSASVSSVGIYGFNPSKDANHLTASQIAQMMWYFVDGKSRSRQESGLQDRLNFNEYHTVFAEVDTIFIQSKRTGRWWMQLPDKRMVPCSYKDYLYASNNEIPERWLRAQERDI